MKVRGGTQGVFLPTSQSLLVYGGLAAIFGGSLRRSSGAKPLDRIAWAKFAGENLKEPSTGSRTARQPAQFVAASPADFCMRLGVCAMINTSVRGVLRKLGNLPCDRSGVN